MQLCGSVSSCRLLSTGIEPRHHLAKLLPASAPLSARQALAMSSAAAQKQRWQSLPRTTWLFVQQISHRQPHSFTHRDVGSTCLLHLSRPLVICSLRGTGPTCKPLPAGLQQGLWCSGQLAPVSSLSLPARLASSSTLIAAGGSRGPGPAGSSLR